LLFDGQRNTRIVKRVAGNEGGLSPRILVVFNSILYFSGITDPQGLELWRSDGTAAGTYLFKDINTNNSDSSNPGCFTIFDGALFFGAEDGVNGRELWKTDCTETGTVMAQDIFPGVAENTINSGDVCSNDIAGFDQDARGQMGVLSSNLYFGAKGSDSVRREIWTLGSSTGTASLFIDLFPLPFRSSFVQEMTEMNGELFFSATSDNRFPGTVSGEEGNELWKTDGTVEGTVLVKDIVLVVFRQHSRFLIMTCIFVRLIWELIDGFYIKVMAASVMQHL